MIALSGFGKDATTGPPCIGTESGCLVDVASITAVPTNINPQHAVNTAMVIAKLPTGPQSRFQSCGTRSMIQALVKSSSTATDVASRNPNGQFVTIAGTANRCIAQNAARVTPTANRNLSKV